MTSEEFINMVANCVAWANEAPKREIYAINYKPSDKYSKPYIIISEREVGNMAVYSASDELDIPKAERRQKIKELERLQKELADE